MMLNIFATGIKRGHFRESGDARLSMEFASTKDGTARFEWTPRWNAPGQDVRDLLREAVRVERINRPDSAWLLEFAELARGIII